MSDDFDPFALNPSAIPQGWVPLSNITGELNGWAFLHADKISTRHEAKQQKLGPFLPSPSPTPRGNLIEQLPPNLPPYDLETEEPPVSAYLAECMWSLLEQLAKDALGTSGDAFAYLANDGSAKSLDPGQIGKILREDTDRERLQSDLIDFQAGSVVLKRGLAGKRRVLLLIAKEPLARARRHLGLENLQRFASSLDQTELPGTKKSGRPRKIDNVIPILRDLYPEGVKADQWKVVMSKVNSRLGESGLQTAGIDTVKRAWNQVHP